MTIDDFIDHLFARIRSHLDAASNGGMVFEAGRGSAAAYANVLSWIGTAHVFCLGEDQALEESLARIGEDVLDDMREGLPMPFKSLLMIWRSTEREKWCADWLQSTGTSHIEGRGHIETFAGMQFNEDVLAKGATIEPMAFALEFNRRPPRLVIVPDFFGSLSSGFKTPPPRIDDAVQHILRKYAWDVVLRCAAISHPSLYTVRSSPILTPREDRLFRRNGWAPNGKRPRYIVVDHSGLEELRKPGLRGQHAPPAPHERRGHWRRLAERCVQARAEGRERVWVRPAMVGDLEFADERSRYQVILDSSPERTLPAGK